MPDWQESGADRSTEPAKFVYRQPEVIIRGRERGFDRIGTSLYVLGIEDMYLVSVRVLNLSDTLGNTYAERVAHPNCLCTGRHPHESNDDIPSRIGARKSNRH